MKKLQRGLPRGRYSKHGYKRNSPDVNKPFNIIPSGRITMQDVDFPVRGVDNLGNEMLMVPGGEYFFPGDYVIETPLMQGGGPKFQQYTPAAESTGANYTPTYFGGTLPEVMISSDGTSYPYYNKLTAEEKKYFNQNNPFGRAVRSIASTGKRGETTNDLSEIARRVEEFAAEMTGIPGSIRFSQDPVKKLKGLGRTVEATILGSSPFITSPYNKEDVADTFDALDALGFATTAAGLVKTPLQKAANLTGKYLTQGPLKNAYRLNPVAAKQPTEVILSRVQRPGQTADLSRLDELLQKSPESLTLAEKIELARINQPGYGRGFSSNPNDISYYSSPGIQSSRGYVGMPEIRSIRLPAEEAARFNIRQNPVEGYFSGAPGREYLLPRNYVESSKTLTPQTFGELEQIRRLTDAETTALNTPHWWRGYPITNTPKQLPGSPNIVGEIVNKSITPIGYDPFTVAAAPLELLTPKALKFKPKTYAIKNRFDAWRLYNGLEPEFNTFSKNADGTLAINDFRLEKSKLQAIVDNPKKSFGTMEIEPEFNFAGVHGNGWVTKGVDDQGRKFIDFTDTWDLQPLKGVKGLPKKVKEFEVSSLTGGKPFDLKNRIYYDDAGNFFDHNGNKLVEEIQHFPKGVVDQNKAVDLPMLSTQNVVGTKQMDVLNDWDKAKNQKFIKGIGTLAGGIGTGIGYLTYKEKEKLKKENKKKYGGWLDEYQPGGQFNFYNDVQKLVNLPKLQRAFSIGGITTLPKAQSAGQTSSTPFRFYDYQTSPTYSGGTLPEVMVSSDNVPYPYYNRLTPEEKKFFNQDNPIGRSVRSIANTGKRGQTYNDLSRVAKNAESFAAEMTGIPGSIRFAQDPVKKLKGAGRTIEATILGSSPFVNAPYNQEDVADTFDAMDAFGWAAAPFSFAKEPLKQSVKLPLQVIKRPSKQTARSLKNAANTLKNIPNELVNAGFRTDPFYHHQRFFDKKNEIAKAIKTDEGRRRIQGYIDKNPHLQNKTVDNIISDFEKTTFEVKAPKYNSKTNEWVNSFVNPNNAYNWYRKGLDNPSYMSIGQNFTPYDASHILEHEFAHVFQRNKDIIGVDDVLSSIAVKSDKDFLVPNKKTFKDYFNKYNPFVKKEKDVGYSVTGDIFGTGENQVNRIPSLERQRNYWLFGNGKGQEKAAFAAEVRENLLQKGILKDRYDEISPKMLKKHYGLYHNTTGNKYNLRLYDIMTNNKNNFNFLSEALNNMITTVPYVGAGSLGYQGLQQSQTPEQKYGGVLPKAQAGAFGTITTPVPFTSQKENAVIPKRFALPRIQPKVNPVVPEMITIKDGRKIRLTTGQAINPNTDLVGKSYSTKALRSILNTAKNRGLSKDDALTLAAIDLQETRWGETDNNMGHVIYKNGFARSPAENFINAYLKSKETADRLKLSDEYTRLQVYNGLGTVTPDTEKDYHGFRMKKIYGVPVPASGINMRKNPLYGKQIVDIRDNVLKQNPEFLKLVDEYYKMGGVTNEMLDVYKNYINGVYTNTEKEKDAIKIYDKLNRKYYREAKNANKSVPNYIMSLIK